MRKEVTSLLAGAFLLQAGLASADGWRIETVAPAGPVGEATSLAIDSRDIPHVSFCYWGMIILKYARRAGKKWNVTTVDGDRRVGAYSSIAVDSADRLHIAYYNNSFGQLKYARWTGSRWALEVVDSGGVGRYASLAIDGGDGLHIAYLDDSNWNLKYAVKNGSKWKITTVDDSYRVGNYCSMALDSKGNPHISYLDHANSRIKYAYLAENRWSINTIYTIGGQYLDSALDSKDRPHISYFRLNYPYSELRYVRWNGQEWQDEVVDTGDHLGRYTSIAIDQSDLQHISYQGGDSGDLKYASYNGNKWDIAVVETEGYGRQNSSLALDSHEYPHISYYNGDINSIKYARWDPTLGGDLTSFEAETLGYNVIVAWALHSQNKFAGFNLYRTEASAAGDDSRLKLNAELIKGRSPYLFVDEDVHPGGEYRYWLEAVDLSGARETYGPAEVRLPTKPAAFALYQSAPNPTRGKTTFAFSLAAAGPAELAVYDLAGREVWRYEGTYAEGANELEATFDLAPGVYIYRLEAGGEAAAKKMVVVNK